MPMHEPTPEDAAAARETLEWALARLADRRSVLPAATPAGALPALTAQGIGAQATMRLLRDVVFPTAIPPDHPRFLAFIPGTPTVVAAIADMALSPAMIFGGSRLEAGMVLDAEDAALRWLADAAGFPASAQGTFVSGGSIANLSALVAARGNRHAAPRRQVIVAGASAHSSMAAAARIMGCDLCAAPPADDHGRLTGATLAAALEGRDPEDVVAVVATAGATNNGAVDDLAGVAEVCTARGIWLHVDGAYGGAALLSPRTRPLFDGIERADSFIVNPHKWLYAPFDCAAVLYRDGAAATARAHPGGRLPRRHQRRRRGQPVRPRHPPHAASARRAPVGVAHGVRHSGLRRGGGPLPRHRRVRRRADRWRARISNWCSSRR